MTDQPCYITDPEIWKHFCRASKRSTDAPSDLWTVADVYAWFVDCARRQAAIQKDDFQRLEGTLRAGSGSQQMT